MTQTKLTSLTDEFGRLDKSRLTVVSSFEEAEAANKAYWMSVTPEKRLRYLEYLRRLNYGHRATARLQRILKVIIRP